MILTLVGVPYVESALFWDYIFTPDTMLWCHALYDDNAVYAFDICILLMLNTMNGLS